MAKQPNKPVFDLGKVTDTTPPKEVKEVLNPNIVGMQAPTPKEPAPAPKTEKMLRVNVEILESEKLALKGKAGQAGITISEVIRKAVKEYLAKG